MRVLAGRCALVAILLTCALTAPQAPARAAGSADLSGEVQLSARGRPVRGNEAQNVIVYFRPQAATILSAMAEEQIMDTVRKEFVPRVLAVTPGTTVRFPNSDPILHNAFSRSAPNEFDTGLYGRGDGVTVQFDHPGHVRVYCNVHHSMVGHILVLDTPFFTRADARGQFRLDGLPAGPGELLVWHERSPLFRQQVTLSDGEHASVRVTLELSTRRVPQHSNKFGEPYRSRPDGHH